MCMCECVQTPKPRWVSCQSICSSILFALSQFSFTFCSWHYLLDAWNKFPRQPLKYVEQLFSIDRDKDLPRVIGQFQLSSGIIASFSQPQKGPKEEAFSNRGQKIELGSFVSLFKFGISSRIWLTCHTTQLSFARQIDIFLFGIWWRRCWKKSST